MTNEMNPVGWFEIYTKDMNRAKSFYETVLGMPLTKLPQSGDSLDDMWTFPMNQGASGATGALAKMDGAPVGPGGTIIYFITEDCAKTAQRAKEAGGQIVRTSSRSAVRQHRAGADWTATSSAFIP